MPALFLPQLILYLFFLHPHRSSYVSFSICLLFLALQPLSGSICMTPTCLPCLLLHFLCCCSVAQLCLTLRDSMNCNLHQAPLSMEFSRQEYWSIAIPYSKGSSRPRDQTSISCGACTGRQVLYHLSHQRKVNIIRTQFSAVAQLCPTLCDPMD